MLAEVLETYTPEARYSKSTFLDGVESYFGYETRRAISMDSTVHDGNLVLNELHLYGSARLGMIQTHDTLFEFDLRSYYDLGNTQTPEGYNLDISQPHVWDSLYTHQRGSKVYEGTNHLGNILVTFSDKRITDCQEDTVYRYIADVRSQTDYSAFGVLLEERQWYSDSDTNSAIYGFNGMRKDNEIYGSGNAYDFGARIYDPRRGQWASVDRMTNLQPSQSPYKVMLNNPLNVIDPDGNIEYEIIVVYKSGVRQEPKMRIVDANKVMTDAVIHTVPSKISNSYSFENRYYNFSTVRIIHEDDNGKITDGGSYREIYSGGEVMATSAIYFNNADKYDTKTLIDLRGSGGEQEGGWHLVSKSGKPGAEPTKQRALTHAEQIEIDFLFGAIGAKGKSAKPSSGPQNIPEVLNNGKGIIDNSLSKDVMDSCVICHNVAPRGTMKEGLDKPKGHYKVVETKSKY